MELTEVPARCTLDPWGVEYNYRRGSHALDTTPVPQLVAQFAAACGTDARTYSREWPGMSAFVLEGGVVYHTYSTYARGLDGLLGMYQWLDRAPKGHKRGGRLVVAPPRRIRQALMRPLFWSRPGPAESADRHLALDKARESPSLDARLPTHRKHRP